MFREVGGKLDGEEGKAGMYGILVRVYSEALLPMKGRGKEHMASAEMPTPTDFASNKSPDINIQHFISKMSGNRSFV